jgi:hypothetical protein
MDSFGCNDIKVSPPGAVIARVAGVRGAQSQRRDHMGLLTTGVEFLIQAKKEGARFDTTVTLGRQGMFISPVRLGKMLRKHELWPDSLGEEAFYREQFGAPYYADAFFRLMGARTLHVLDYSPYEGATLVHDLNAPLDPALHETADLVFDGGTLEHVFNFPTAVRSCMELTKVGGRLVMVTPANNYSGHGFYQFSPELLYRVLSADNGFEVERIYLCENEAYGARLGKRSFAAEYRSAWYAVPDPAVVRERVTLAGPRPTLMFVRARRVERKAMFVSPPLQSDYAAAWTDEDPDHGERGGGGGDLDPVGPATTAAAKPAPAPPDDIRRWARMKDVQLHWLPLLTRLNPWFVWSRLRPRRLGNRKVFQRQIVP